MWQDKFVDLTGIKLTEDIFIEPTAQNMRQEKLADLTSTKLWKDRFNYQQIFEERQIFSKCSFRGEVLRPYFIFRPIPTRYIA